MEKIVITIDDDLTPEQELREIANTLARKALPGSKTKLLGTGYDLKHRETQIVIKRKEAVKPIVTEVCSACDTTFEKKLGKRLYMNYGGPVKARLYCGEECRDLVLSLVGEGRASIKKKDLKPMRLWK